MVTPSSSSNSTTTTSNITSNIMNRNRSQMQMHNHPSRRNGSSSSGSSSTKISLVCCCSLLLMMSVLNVKVSTSTLSYLSSSEEEHSSGNVNIDTYKDRSSTRKRRGGLLKSSSSSFSSQTTTTSAVLQHVLEVNDGLMQKARQYLERGNNECPSSYRHYPFKPDFNCEQDTFKDLIVSLPLRDYDEERRRTQQNRQHTNPQQEQKEGQTRGPGLRIGQQHSDEGDHQEEEEDVYHKFVGRYQEVKGMLHPRLAFPSKDNCVVYGIGIHDDSRFERHMTNFCNHVHAFDCTVKPTRLSVKRQPFTFHQTCIGSESMIDSVSKYGNNQRQLSFKSLAGVMKDLGHDRIDLLKFDVEGSEWELFENEILQLPQSKLPKQLLFELHTAGANPNFVPMASVKGRDRLEVNRLMLRLFDVGYRIIEQERNDGDPYCTEISMIRIE